MTKNARRGLTWCCVQRLLLVPKGFYRVQSRRARCGKEPEENPRECARGERGDDSRYRSGRRHGREGGFDPQSDENAEHESDGSADARERRGFYKELPENRALRCTERLANADLTGALGDADHHDCDDSHTADEQPNRRQSKSDDEERPEQL